MNKHQAEAFAKAQHERHMKEADAYYMLGADRRLNDIANRNPDLDIPRETDRESRMSHYNRMQYARYAYFSDMNIADVGVTMDPYVFSALKDQVHKRFGLGIHDPSFQEDPEPVPQTMDKRPDYAYRAAKTWWPMQGGMR